MFFTIIEVKIKIHSLPKINLSLPNNAHIISLPIALPAETKIFTIWNESDYFNEELQTSTVFRSGYGLANGNSTEERYRKSQQRQN